MCAWIGAGASALACFLLRLLRACLTGKCIASGRFSWRCWWLRSAVWDWLREYLFAMMGRLWLDGGHRDPAYLHRVCLMSFGMGVR
jgi:hypothetical protein